MEGDQVFMRFNEKGAAWELVTYSWAGAIAALGNSYDLRLVRKDGTEVMVREKTPVMEAPKPIAAPASNVIDAFENWWLANEASYGPENKSTVREVYLAGYAAK